MQLPQPHLEIKETNAESGPSSGKVHKMAAFSLGILSPGDDPSPMTDDRYLRRLDRPDTSASFELISPNRQGDQTAARLEFY